ncbi:MAG: ArnT family glycosyltransferase [Minisyncoccota bacterium]
MPLPKIGKPSYSTYFLIAIIALGIFLRFFFLTDWTHFELDQARDARVIDLGLNGDIFDLPLLGPKAGGTFLRLGPGFYWLEYIGALLFGGAVIGSVVMVALTSVASIPLFYLIVKRIFVARLALGLTLLSAVSVFMVLYGRFAWNPNLLPFFTLLGCYGLLRTVDNKEAHRGRWLMVSALALGLGTQMHFLAFLALPTIAVVFLLIKRPRIALKFWLGSFGIIAFLYLPMALNEIATGGLNTQEFLGAISEKSTKEDHSLVEKAIRNVSEFGLQGIIITTGFEGAMFPVVVIEDGGIEYACDRKCDDGKWYGLFGIFILGLSLITLGYNLCAKKTSQRTDALLLSSLWFGVTFVLFLPLAYGVAPRFFLLNAPLFFILLGLLTEFCEGCVSRRKRWGNYVGVAVIAIFISLNSLFLIQRFDELSHAGTEKVESNPDRILKERVRVTLKQQLAIVDFMEHQSVLNGNVPVYMFSEPQYRRALKYLMEQRGLENDVLGFSGIYRQGVSFLIIRASSNVESGVAKYLDMYTVGKTTSFGTLIAIELHPKPESITGERQDFSVPEATGSSSAPPRYTTREFLTRTFGEKSPAKTDDESTEE